MCSSPPLARAIRNRITGDRDTVGLGAWKLYSRLSAGHSVSGLLVVVCSAKIRLLIGRLWGRLFVLGSFHQPEIGLDGVVCKEDCFLSANGLG